METNAVTPVGLFPPAKECYITFRMKRTAHASLK